MRLNSFSADISLAGAYGAYIMPLTRHDSDLRSWYDSAALSPTLADMPMYQTGIARSARHLIGKGVLPTKLYESDKDLALFYGR